MNTKIKVTVSACVAALFCSFIILGFFGMDGRTNTAIVDYLNSAGWQTGARPAEISHFKIPEEFNAVFMAYNVFQTDAGFDLSNYRGKRVARYSYTVKNHRLSETGEVRANVYVYKGDIIAADISQTGKDGFMQSITDTSDMIK